jgi:hypothetical protein
MQFSHICGSFASFGNIFIPRFYSAILLECNNESEIELSCKFFCRIHSFNLWLAYLKSFKEDDAASACSENIVCLKAVAVSLFHNDCKNCCIVCARHCLMLSRRKREVVASEFMKCSFVRWYVIISFCFLSVFWDLQGFEVRLNLLSLFVQ